METVFVQLELSAKLDHFIRDLATELGSLGSFGEDTFDSCVDAANAFFFIYSRTVS